MNTQRTTSEADTFVLHEKRYLVDRVISNAATGPTITPKLEEIDLKDDPTSEQTNPVGAKNYQGPVVFYQYEGKYIILIGYQHAVDSVIDARAEGDEVLTLKGKLLTKHSLKRCLVDANHHQTRRIIEEQLRGDEVRPRDHRDNRFQSSDRYDRNRF